MNLFTRMLLPLAAVSAFAAPALAQNYRIPTDATPSIEVAKQTGWTERYDESGNLLFFADDGAGGLLFRVVDGKPGEKMPSNASAVEVILGAAGAKPYSRSEKTTFAGGPAEAFYSTMSVDGGPVIELKVVVRRLGDSHLVVGVTMIPQAASAAKRQKVEAQFAQVKIIAQ
jgi:hypothetical protein